MKVFLAGTGLLKNYPEEFKKSKYILESFYSIQEWQIPLIKTMDCFLLDSGAFTFMNSNKKTSFDAYIDRYIDFINRNNIELFFELDVDSVIGYENVKKLTSRLEKETGKKSIPVWHLSRGIDNFYRMCDEYEYAAIGGFVTKEIQRKKYGAIPYLIQEAHKRKCKLHGLGFTSTSYYDKIRFDSVDSTTWNVGGKYGNICLFDSKIGMRQNYYAYNNNKRCINQKELMTYNWNQWIQYQRFAEKHL